MCDDLYGTLPVRVKLRISRLTYERGGALQFLSAHVFLLIMAPFVLRLNAFVNTPMHSLLTFAIFDFFTFFYVFFYLAMFCRFFRYVDAVGLNFEGCAHGHDIQHLVHQRARGVRGKPGHPAAQQQDSDYHALGSHGRVPPGAPTPPPPP